MEMDIYDQIDELLPRRTPRRLEKMLRALEWRTRRITVVMEDVFQPHNAAAVLRSCDAFGIQDVYILENLYKLKIDRGVDTGVSKWMTLNYRSLPTASSMRFGMHKPDVLGPDARENTRLLLSELKRKGYLLAASSLTPGACSIDSVPVDRPVALLIGTELSGLSPAAHEMADVVFSIPMLGFAQSFNLSVFAALCLQKICLAMRALDDSWKMSEAEKKELLLKWLRTSIDGEDSK